MARRLLDIGDLHVSFGRDKKEVRAVRGVSLHVDEGETVSLVGESGSGKSVTALSVMRLLPYPQAWHPGGSIVFDGQELMGAPDHELRALSGNRIAMIFQEPMTSLNPLHPIEKQIRAMLLLHPLSDRDRARARTIELLGPGGPPR